jgi:hypothetical protein
MAQRLERVGAARYADGIAVNVANFNTTASELRYGAEVLDALDVGWDEQALHDAVSVCALFNLMNRLVEGLEISAGADYFAMASQRLAGEGGYAGYARC